MGALVNVIEWWIEDDHTLTVDEMAANTLELFLRNIQIDIASKE